MTRPEAFDQRAFLAVVGQEVDGLAELTLREREVLSLIAIGRTNRQIADTLVISVPTADRHVHNILGKLGCANRTEAAVIARRAPGAGQEAPVLAVVQGAQSTAERPYPGLRAFAADDAPFFFGREEAEERLVARLRSTRVLTVVGASGRGKTSIVRAGIVPALQAGALPGSADWHFLIMTPGAEPLIELASKFAVANEASAEQILGQLERDPGGFEGVLEEACAGCPDDFRFILVVDQFEELFTMCRDREERQRFVDALLHASS